MLHPAFSVNEPHSIQYKNSVLHYYKTGTGVKHLLLFHGFGQTHEVFDSLTKSLSTEYTLYSFDIFFHGSSLWNEGEQALEKSDWAKTIEPLLSQHALKTFSVLGFSMGGKFALATLEAFPNQTDELFLLAPDGVKTSTWYSLATYPHALRNLFKSMILKPQRFYAITKFASAIGLVDKGILRFADSQMNTEEKRKRVYHSWVVFRHLTFDMNTIASVINEKNIRLVMIAGKYDKIITVRNMNNLLNHVKFYQLEIPETGHNGVIGASAIILSK